MLFVIAFIIAGFLIFFGGSALKKHPIIFYSAGAVITAAVIIIDKMTKPASGFVNDYLIGVFREGAFAAALWVLVMYAGALTTETKPGKTIVSRIMPVRGELSIFAAVITVSHAVTYGLTYLNRFNTFRKNNISFPFEFTLTCIVCIVLLLIMVPLTVMSIKAIRKKMNAKTWKKIQRAAYVFYALIYIHILVLYIPKSRSGNTEKFISIIVYSIVFICYAALRIRKEIIKKNKDINRKPVNAVTFAASAILVGTVIFLSYGTKPESGAAERSPVTVQTTTTASSDENEKADETVTTTVAATTDKDGKTAPTTTKTDGTVTTVSGAATTSTSSKDEDKTEETTAAEEEKSAEENPDEPVDEPVQEEPAPTEAPQTEPAQPQTVFKNGTWSGVGLSPADDEGKDFPGDVYADVTIENDVITNISVTFQIDDKEYYVIAESVVIDRILSSNSPDVDAVCGATRSAEGIISAVRDALDQARN